MTDQVAIIGLGLIGGSLARDLAARGVQLIGYDLDARALRAALDENVITRALSSDLEGIEAADVVVLALPVQVAPAVLAEVAGRVGHAHLITDVGSTKSGIVAAAERLGLGERFIGGHPLAGDHSSGWSASRRELFRGARVFLCPGALTRPDVLDRARALWTLVGAVPELCPPDAHDARIAWISHLPQVVSSALALALADQHIARSELGPGGRGVTRLAGSAADMWTAIALDNGAAIALAIRALEHRLGAARQAIDAGDAEAIRQLFAKAADWAAGLSDPQSPRLTAGATSD